VSAQRPAVWRLAPELHIGADYDFTRILALLPAADGSVVIADAGNNELYVFRRDGAYSHTIGRNGRGPGEFGRVGSAGLLGDTLWVFDPRERRTSLFSLDGKVVATIRTETRGSLTALFPGGAALGLTSSDFGSGTEFRDVQIPVILTTRAGRTLDTLAWVPYRNANFVLRRSDGFTIGSQPFSDAGLTIFAPSSPVFFIVDRSVTTTPHDAAFSVVALRSNGDTLWNRSYRYVPRRLEKARGDSLLAAKLTLTRAGHASSEIRGAVFIPDYYAPVTSGMAGSDGSLWLRREDREPTVAYWVIAKDGSLVATVIVPSNLSLMAATATEVWGVAKDQYDVPTVIRYRINR